MSLKIFTQILLVTLSSICMQVQGQSKDLESPTTLTSKTIDGLANPVNEEPVYYSFCLGTAGLKITGDVTSGYGGCQMTFHFLNANYDEIAAGDFWGEQNKKRTVRQFKLPKGQNIILKITFNGTTTDSKFVLEGDVRLTGDCRTSIGTNPTPVPANNGANSTGNVNMQIGDTYGGGQIFDLTTDGKHGTIFYIISTNKFENSRGPSWQQARQFVKDPANFGAEGKKYKNWRLPTVKEIENLLILKNNKIGRNIIFTVSNCWTNEEDKNSPNMAFLYLCDGCRGASGKAFKLTAKDFTINTFVMAVRNF